MEITLGKFPAQTEAPETIKFASPIVLVPELFTTRRHMAVLLGYLATVGWEVFLPDYRAVLATESGGRLGRVGFAQFVKVTGEALDALGREAVVMGFGFGGSLALKLAERPGVKAAVAFAPLVPGVRTRLVAGIRNRLLTWLGLPLSPPSGRALFDLIADVEPYQRQALITALLPDASRAAAELIRGQVQIASAEGAAPRIIVVGDSDAFVPVAALEPFARALGAPLKIIPGRGHWLISGRALERAFAEAHRFLVRALGQDLLLLLPEELKE